VAPVAQEGPSAAGVVGTPEVEVGAAPEVEAAGHSPDIVQADA
jgi:hypothetical protein